MSFTLVQSKTAATGTGSAGSLSVTVTSTTSGNLLVAFLDLNGVASDTITPPTGWSQVGTSQGYASGNGTVAMYYLNPSSNSGGATSFSFSFSTNANAALAFEEWSSSTGWAATVLDTFVAQQNAKSTSCTTGTTGALAGSGELGIWGVGVGATATLTYSSITNGYVEDTGANAHSGSATEAEATLFYNTSVGSAATSSGCTMSGTGSTGNTTILAVFKAAPAVAHGSTLALMGVG